ncbi:MAG: helix-turn-helix domain-containing protein [Acidobacteriia bacterium]|nr:helix-turn-helix domain-containing protein [Terriglobia bacterium]
MLEFVFSDPFEIHWCDRPLVETTPRTVLIGLQTHRRVRLVTKGTLESFFVAFQPAGLFRLFSLPLHELTNHDCEARAVLGTSVSHLHERLGACGSLEERARVTDDYLLRVCFARSCSDGVSAAANEILHYHGQVRIAGLADGTGLSLRQFERRFSQEVGMRPKLYARIARFEAALDSKARSLAKSWTEVAHEFGYHDQMHLVHDFEQFSGETPTNLLTEVENAYRALIDAVRLGRMPAGQAPRLML